MPEIPPEEKIDKFIKWMHDGYSVTKDIEIQIQSFNERGVIAKKDFDKGDIIMKIPADKIITLEMTYQTELGKLMRQRGLNEYNLRLTAPKNSFFAAFLMDEEIKPAD